MKKNNQPLTIVRVLAGSIILIYGLSQLLSVLGGNTKEKVNHIPYAYGEVITKENTVEGSKYSLSEGVEFIITEQNVLSKEEIKGVNEFNDAENEVAVLEIEINNNSEEDFDYNIFGVNYASTNNVQLDYLSGILFELPSPYKSMEDLGSGSVKPNNTVKKIRTITVPEGEKVKTIYWDYFGTKFTVELP